MYLKRSAHTTTLRCESPRWQNGLNGESIVTTRFRQCYRFGNRFNIKIPSDQYRNYHYNHYGWRHNVHNGVSNHQPRDCLLNHLFRRRSKKTWKLRVTGLCVGNSPGTGEFPAQMASNAENVSIWWRHHVMRWPHDRRIFIMGTRYERRFWYWNSSTEHIIINMYNVVI